MKNIFITIFVAFLLSLLFHYIIFVQTNDSFKNNTLKNSTTNKINNDKKNGFTNIKFVKIKKVKPMEKNKKVVKKTTKKRTKKIVKQEIKPIEKIVKKDIKKQKTIDLKQFFTVKKEYKKNYTKDINNTKQHNTIQEIKDIGDLDEVTQSYIKLYGKQYFSFSKEEKKYIKNNISLIGKITQKYLKYPNVSIRTHQSGINVVEFTLWPNGDIKNLNLIDSSQYTALDQNSINTIKIAYKDYPKPVVATKIRIYVNYILN